MSELHQDENLQQDLLGDQSGVPPEVESGGADAAPLLLGPGLSPDQPLYLLTNRSNLRYWLSTGVIGPRELFADDRYWSDLLELAPGRLVAFRGSLGFATDAVVRDAIGEFPVAVEIRRGDLGLIEEVACDAKSGAGVWLTESWLPTSVIKRVVYRNEDNLGDYRAQRFADTPDPAVMDVDPTVFEGEQWMRLSELEAALARTVAPSSEGAVLAAIDAADRMAGAVCMCTAALLGNPAGAQRFRATSDSVQSLDGLAAMLRPLTGLTSKAGESLRAVLAGVQHLRVSEGWDPSEVMDDVKERLHSGTARSRQKKIADQFDYMDDVLAMRAKLDVASPLLFDDSLTALLFFLLHPRPEEALEWTAVETASHPVRILTCALSGLAQGMSRLDVDLKTPALLSGLVTWYLDALALPGSRPAVADKITARLTSTRDVGGTTEILFGQEVVGCRETVSTTDLLLQTRLEAPALADRLVSIARSMDWDDCLIQQLVIRSDKDVLVQSIEHIADVTHDSRGLRALLAGAYEGLVIRYKGSRVESAFPDVNALRLRLEKEGLSTDAGREYRRFAEEAVLRHPADHQRDAGVPR